MKKPILSISLLSSGRKKTIKNCLDSLIPIMEQLSCELIIVDTGCDEETRELMLNYTDKIIPFTWCNDFSKARNAGLEKAKGEWFMYIDDDEWFIDVQEIVDFFASGEYRNYAIAHYIQRNFSDYQEKRYSDSWVSRLIRLDEDTRFVSSIHEHLYPVKGACKLLHSPVKHFGYIFDTEQEKYEHSKRNISLLVDMIEKERNNIRWWAQIAQEYRGIQEYTKLKEVCLEALEVVRDMDNAWTSRALGTFYSGAIFADMVRYNYKDAEISLERAFGDKRVTPICIGRLYAFGAELYYKERRYEECEKYCKEYLKIYDKYFGNERLLLEQTAFFVQDVFDDEVRNNVYCFYMGCALKRGDSSVLKEFFWKMGWKNQMISLFTSIITDIIEAFAKMEYEPEFTDIMRTLLERKGVDNDTIKEMMRIEKSDSEGFAKLCRIVAEVDKSNYFICYMKIRYADDTGDMTCCYEYYEELFGGVQNLLELDDSVFDIAVKHGIDLDSLFLKVPFEQWKNGVDLFCKQVSADRFQKRKELVAGMKQTKNNRYDYLLMKFAEQSVYVFDENDDLGTLQNKLIDFEERTLKFYQQFFKKNAFLGEMEMLPGPCKVAVKLNHAFGLKKEGQIKKFSEALKKCLGIYRPLDKAIRAYTKLYIEEQKKLMEERKSATEELQILAVQVKEKIKLFVEQEKYQEALSVCLQLKSLVPDDKEAIDIEQQIREKIS